MFDQYLNSLPKLRPALVTAGIPEDVAEIVEAEFTKSGFFGERSLLPLIILPTFWLLMFLMSVASSALADALGRWPAIALIGAIGGLGGIGISHIAVRYSRWLRARLFVNIALNRSHAYSGRKNVRALNASIGKAGDAYICAAISSANNNAFVFMLGAVMTAAFSLPFS